MVSILDLPKKTAR